MNDTPTPRTDAEHAQFPMGGFTLDFARKLERELAAAREELAELKAEYGTWWAQKRIAIDELKEVTEQRDRLAEELKNIKCAFCGETQQTENEKAYCQEFSNTLGELPTMAMWLLTKRKP
jgi:DNA repair exonuclease SbcCD ATPase subunit